MITFLVRGRAARVKVLEAEKSTLLARAEAAERVLVKGESKDQARMEALTDESRASRLKFLALSERLRQMSRLRDQVRDIHVCVQNCTLVRSRGRPSQSIF
jgi:hypothetical protein